MAHCGCGAGPALPKKITRSALEQITGTTSLRDKEVKALYRRFRLLAPSGFLLSDQFKQTMGVLGLTDDPFLPDRMFQIFDADQDGKLSFFEFASSLAVMIRGSEDEKLKLSFEMTAGQRGASGIRLEDFEKLIHACSRMTESLVTPDTRPVDSEHVRGMFNEISSGESVITMDDYRQAAQSHDDFLVCLGVLAPSAANKSFRTRSGDMRDRRKANMSGTTLNSFPSGSQDLVTLPVSQIEEMKEKMTMLRNVVLAEKFSGSEKLSGKSSSSTAPAVAPQPDDPDERWWTPLARKNSRASPGPKRSVVVVEEETRTADDVIMEFDRVIDWCSNATKQYIPTSGYFSEGGAQSLDEREHSRASDMHLIGLTNVGASPAQGAYSAWQADDGSTSINSEIFVSNPEVKRRGPSLNAISERSHTAGTIPTYPTNSQLSRGKSHKPLSNPKGGRRRRHRLLGPKKGLAVHFGHENWNMVLSMMIGIRMSVGRIKHEMSREVTPVDFIMKEKVSIIPRLANIFDSEVSKRVTMTRFYDYAPMVFQKIRSTFGIHHDDYLRSVGPEQLLGNMVLGNLSSLAELSSEGKSGAFFYYTADGKYMMKTVTPKEQQLLKRMLKKYYDHIMKNSSTLIVRFLGLHCLRVRKTHSHAGRLIHADRKLHFVVMANMFNTPFEIHCRYDLKGSYVGRVTHDRDTLDPSIALKDVDFTEDKQIIKVGSELKEQLIKQIESDSAFLRDNNVIDYSLLLGIHNLGEEESLDDEKNPGKENSMHASHAHSSSTVPRISGSAAITASIPTTSSPDRQNSQAALPRSDLGGLLSHDGRQRYFFGIIDILTPYDTRKRVEHHAKAIWYDRRGVSCCPPTFYAERFNDFMSKAFE